MNPWFIALTVTLATFMEVLDTSIANVSLPHIAGGLTAGVANPRVQQMLHGATSALRAEATRQAYGLLQRILERQSSMLSYIDAFHLLALATVAMMPFVLLIRKPKRRGGMIAH